MCDEQFYVVPQVAPVEGVPDRLAAGIDLSNDDVWDAVVAASVAAKAASKAGITVILEYGPLPGPALVFQPPEVPHGIDAAAAGEGLPAFDGVQHRALHPRPGGQLEGPPLRAIVARPIAAIAAAVAAVAPQPIAASAPRPIRGSAREMIDYLNCSRGYLNRSNPGTGADGSPPRDHLGLGGPGAEAEGSPPRSHRSRSPSVISLPPTIDQRARRRQRGDPNPEADEAHPDAPHPPRGG